MIPASLAAAISSGRATATYCRGNPVQELLNSAGYVWLAVSVT